MCEVCGSGNGRCGKCGGMCGFGRNHVLRWILGIIIITWVFSIGMKIGELKANLDQSYGYGHRVMPMMYGATQSGWSGGESNVMFTTSAVPASAVKTGTVQIIKSN